MPPLPPFPSATRPTQEHPQLTLTTGLVFQLQTRHTSRLVLCISLPPVFIQRPCPTHSISTSATQCKVALHRTRSPTMAVDVYVHRRRQPQCREDDNVHRAMSDREKRSAVGCKGTTMEAFCDQVHRGGPRKWNVHRCSVVLDLPVHDRPGRSRSPPRAKSASMVMSSRRMARVPTRRKLLDHLRGATCFAKNLSKERSRA